MRLLMAEPNVLLLDEPTNDLDIDTLTALEDLLDAWPGTLVVVSHDRYFVERVCDNVYALTDGGGIVHLPGGIAQYLEQRHNAAGQAQMPRSDRDALAPAAQLGPETPLAPGAQLRAARKDTQRSERELKRLERAIEQLALREATLSEQMAASASDHARLVELQSELEQVVTERGAQETAWFEASEALEG